MKKLNQVPYEIHYSFGLNEFVRFMMIQSNVNERIQKQEISVADAEQWFRASLTDIFGDQQQVLIFDGYSWYLTKR